MNKLPINQIIHGDCSKIMMEFPLCSIDIVLDPFCGSGTFCLAAKELGRKYIGIEIDENYHKIAEERLNAKNSFKNS